MPSAPPPTWDIFCRVIDNYGDIGVCWRLARQLANEYPIQVRLWIDEPAALKHIWPSATTAEQQLLERVDVRIWRDTFAGAEPAGVVIEAFACELPASYTAAMKQRPTPPVWINLEYLSAEHWVEDCHGLQSIHPLLGLKKTFFFPGFTGKTGGLLRERELVTRRDSPAQENNRAGLFRRWGLEDTQDPLLISLFSYENPALGPLLDAWQASARPIICLIPAGPALASINAHLQQTLAAGDRFERGMLTLVVMHFLPQDEYDRLLWTCDINFVRGEDSFVRAQWAAKPLIWNIYPQEENAHLLKLDAFLEIYVHNFNPLLAQAVKELWHCWNQGLNCTNAWNQCLADYPLWLEHSKKWCQELNSLDDLAAKLVQFCKKTL